MSAAVRYPKAEARVIDDLLEQLKERREHKSRLQTKLTLYQEQVKETKASIEVCSKEIDEIEDQITGKRTLPLFKIAEAQQQVADVKPAEEAPKAKAEQEAPADSLAVVEAPEPVVVGYDEERTVVTLTRGGDVVSLFIDEAEERDFVKQDELATFDAVVEAAMASINQLSPEALEDLWLDLFGKGIAAEIICISGDESGHADYPPDSRLRLVRGDEDVIASVQPAADQMKIDMSEAPSKEAALGLLMEKFNSLSNAEKAKAYLALRIEEIPFPAETDEETGISMSIDEENFIIRLSKGEEAYEINVDEADGIVIGKDAPYDCLSEKDAVDRIRAALANGANLLKLWTAIAAEPSPDQEQPAECECPSCEVQHSAPESESAQNVKAFFDKAAESEDATEAVSAAEESFGRILTMKKPDGAVLLTNGARTKRVEPALVEKISSIGAYDKAENYFSGDILKYKQEELELLYLSDLSIPYDPNEDKPKPVELGKRGRVKKLKAEESKPSVEQDIDPDEAPHLTNLLRGKGAKKKSADKV